MSRTPFASMADPWQRAWERSETRCRSRALNKTRSSRRFLHASRQIHRITHRSSSSMSAASFPTIQASWRLEPTAAQSPKSGRSLTAANKIRLGLRANWRQFALLVVVNAFVGGVVGVERSTLAPLAEHDFRLD